jgi:hypothetical protein
MKKMSPIGKLVIRTAVVSRPDKGYIIAADLKKEQEEIPHAITFRWEGGVFHKGSRLYDSSSGCLIESPDRGWVDIGDGFYSVNVVGRTGMTSADIMENSQPKPGKRRIPSFRSVAAINGQAYAVGFGGQAYRMDSLTLWTRIDEGLPETFDIDAIHGFGANDIYAVGREGQLWHFDGKVWTAIDLPTDTHLNCVKCAGDGQVYIGGLLGMVIRGRGDAWAVVDHGETEKDIWDIDWFNDEVFVSSMHGVYRLKGERLVPVDFGDDPPGSFYQLSTAEGVMWSNGEFDIMSFDGKRWVRVV